MSECGPWAHAEDVNDLKAAGGVGKISIIGCGTQRRFPAMVVSTPLALVTYMKNKYELIGQSINNYRSQVIRRHSLSQ